MLIALFCSALNSGQHSSYGDDDGQDDSRPWAGPSDRPPQRWRRRRRSDWPGPAPSWAMEPEPMYEHSRYDGTI
jgi:hypothetical protein